MDLHDFYGIPLPARDGFYCVLAAAGVFANASHLFSEV